MNRKAECRAYLDATDILQDALDDAIADYDRIAASIPWWQWVLPWTGNRLLKSMYTALHAANYTINMANQCVNELREDARP